MSADQLLAEITSTSLLSVINAVRHDVAPPPHTGIPPFDDLLVSARKGMEGLMTENALARGDMLEIQGPSASGKTELLNFIILTRILPGSFTFQPISPSTRRTFATPVHLGGSSLSCLIFSLSPSAPFSLARLAQTTKAYILARFTAAATHYHPAIAGRDKWTGYDADVDHLVAQALARVRVWRGSGGVGSWELAVGLKRVEEVVREEFGREGELGLVAVENFGEGHFQDGWEFSQKQSAGASAQALQDPANQPMYHILRALTNIRDTFGPLVVLTTQALLYGVNQAGKANMIPNHHLPFPYASPFPAPGAFANLAFQPRPLPAGIRGITHHLTLVTPEERLGTIDLEKGLGDALREESRRTPRGQVRGFLRVVGGVHGAREGKGWQVGLGENGLEIS